MPAHHVGILVHTRDELYHSRIQPDLFAVSLLHFAILRSFGATIAAIVLTTFVVVIVVTIAVSFVVR